MPDLLDGGPPWLVHAELGETIVKVGNLALATDKSRAAPLVIFLEHGNSRFFSESAPAILAADFTFGLFFFFSFYLRSASASMRFSPYKCLGFLLNYVNPISFVFCQGW